MTRWDLRWWTDGLPSSLLHPVQGYPPKRGSSGCTHGARGNERRMRIAPWFLAAALVGAAPAVASVTVTKGAGSPTLKVDARGDAEVDWTSGGARQSLLLPP